jgi:hypothetical protein
MASDPDNFFIEFEVSAPKRFEALRVVFDAFKNDKENETQRSIEEWQALFDHQARSHFWWPTKREAREHFEKPEDEQPNVGWGFADIIDAIYNAEYSLVSCEYLPKSKGKQQKGRLEFYSDSWPYGSCDALIVLVEALEGVVTAYDRGFGVITAPERLLP